MPKDTYTNADLTDRQPLGIATADPATLRNITPGGPHKLPEPGDPDFDWATYDQWHRTSGHDPVTEAKATLARATALSQSSGLDRANASNASLPAQTQLEHQANDPLGEMLGVAPTALKAAGSAVVHTPAAILESLLHPIDTAKPMVEAASEAIQHPSEIGPAFLQGAADPNITGAAAGNLAVLAATANPEATAEAAGAVTRGAGQGIGAVGRGLTAAGTKVADTKIGGFGLPGAGLLEALISHDPWGMAAAAAPYAVKGVGSALEGVGGAIESIPSRLQSAVDAIKAAVTPGVESRFNPAGPTSPKPAGWASQASDVADISHGPQTAAAPPTFREGEILGERVPPSLRALSAAPETSTGAMNAAPVPKQLGGITADDVASYRQMVDSGYHPDTAARLTVGNDPLAQETLKQQAYGVSSAGPTSPWAMQPRATLTSTPAGTAGPGAFAPGARPTASLDALTRSEAQRLTPRTPEQAGTNSAGLPPRANPPSTDMFDDPLLNEWIREATRRHKQKFDVRALMGK